MKYFFAIFVFYGVFVNAISLTSLNTLLTRTLSSALFEDSASLINLGKVDPKEFLVKIRKINPSDLNQIHQLIDVLIQDSEDEKKRLEDELNAANVDYVSKSQIYNRIFGEWETAQMEKSQTLGKLAEFTSVYDQDFPKATGEIAIFNQIIVILDNLAVASQPNFIQTTNQTKLDVNELITLSTSDSQKFLDKVADIPVSAVNTIRGIVLSLIDNAQQRLVELDDQLNAGNNELAHANSAFNILSGEMNDALNAKNIALGVKEHTQTIYDQRYSVVLAELASLMEVKEILATLPASESSLPASESPLPASESPLPDSEEGPAPESPLPASESPLPASESPLPASESPLPASEEGTETPDFFSEIFQAPQEPP